MAIYLYHFPTPHSLSPHKFSFSSSPNLSIFHHRRLHNSTVIAFAIRKPRVNRKAKSNEELCSEIREFLSMLGLPQNHVPSMKELSKHGRQDLANIVRRRGYAHIRRLLETSMETNVNGSNAEEDLTGKLEAIGDREDGASLSTEAIQEGSTNGLETDGQLRSHDRHLNSSHLSTNILLQEKAAQFIHNGELDTSDGDSFGITNETVGEYVGEALQSEDAPTPETVGEDVGEALQSEDTPTPEIVGEDVGEVLQSEDTPTPELASILSGSSGAQILNENGSRSLQNQNVEHPSLEDINSRNGYISTETAKNVDYDKNEDVETQNNQSEVKRLKFMLHQKEMELTQLKQQIEKEKLALSDLQTKAEAEISNAQKLVSEKDAELHAAEESLTGLKEVEIEYSGDGKTIELAGSFNGWHQRIQMDLDRSASMINPNGPRKPQLWRTVLWLYPGVYEIKFIVDGHWRIDPQKESVNMGSIHNNILRVDR